MGNPYLPLTDDNANDEVACPGCLRPERRASPCATCGANDNEPRVVKRWIAVCITTDGRVR